MLLWREIRVVRFGGGVRHGDEEVTAEFHLGACLRIRVQGISRSGTAQNAAQFPTGGEQPLKHPPLLAPPHIPRDNVVQAVPQRAEKHIPFQAGQKMLYAVRSDTVRDAFEGAEPYVVERMRKVPLAGEVVLVSLRGDGYQRHRKVPADPAGIGKLVG
nr:hypothetical protein [Streptomyces albus]